MEQIIKGHPSLIVKSSELMKLMFEDNKMGERHMAMIWQTMRKGDLETKNSLLNILNNIFYDLSYRNMEYLVNQIADVEPKLLVPDEIELAFKIVNFSKYKADNPGGREPTNLAVAAHYLVHRSQDLLEGRQQSGHLQPRAGQESHHQDDQSVQDQQG
jgi:hypothetical protein